MVVDAYESLESKAQVISTWDSTARGILIPDKHSEEECHGEDLDERDRGRDDEGKYEESNDFSKQFLRDYEHFTLHLQVCSVKLVIRAGM